MRVIAEEPTAKVTDVFACLISRSEILCSVARLQTNLSSLNRREFLSGVLPAYEDGVERAQRHKPITHIASYV